MQRGERALQIALVEVVADVPTKRAELPPLLHDE
jgi:hypothetical protein